jgi:hypothetical protein
MIFYESADVDGTYFINESGEVYREGEPIYANFLAQVDSGEWTVEPYAGSTLETADDAVKLEGAVAAERAWRDAELYASDIELLREIEKDYPALEAKRQELRDYPASPDFLINRPVV